MIIPEQDFVKVQSIIDSRRAEQTEDARTPISSEVLLSGLVVCGECGHKLKADFTYKYWKKKEGETSKCKTYRYVCHHAKNVTNHGQKQWGAKSLDKSVEVEVLKQISSISLQKFEEEKDAFDFTEIDSRKIQLKSLEEQFSNITKALANTEKLFEDIMMGESPMTMMELVQKKMGEFGAKKIDLITQIDKLKAEVKQTEIHSTDLEQLKYQLTNWVENYKNLVELDEKKAQLGRVLKEVKTSKNAIFLVFHITIEKALREFMMEIDDNHKDEEQISLFSIARGQGTQDALY